MITQSQGDLFALIPLVEHKFNSSEPLLSNVFHVAMGLSAVIDYCCTNQINKTFVYQINDVKQTIIM